MLRERDDVRAVVSLANTSPRTSTASAACGRFGTVGLSVLLVADHEAAPALALLRGGGLEPRPLPRALDERDCLQRIESG